MLAKNNRWAPNAQNSDTSVLFLIIRSSGAHGCLLSTSHAPGPLQGLTVLAVGVTCLQGDLPLKALAAGSIGGLAGVTCAGPHLCQPLTSLPPRGPTAYFEAARIPQVHRICFIESKALLSFYLSHCCWRSPAGLLTGHLGAG